MSAEKPPVPPSTSTAASAGKAASASDWGLTSRLREAIQRRPIRSGIYAALACTFLASSYQDRATRKKLEAEDAKEKKVLVLPFYKMKLVEESRRNSLRSLLSSNPASNNVEMSIDECIKVIHEAAADPQIVALYGIMGHGFEFTTGGWAHVEELRNALLVFQQSHRRHVEPGKSTSGEEAKPYTNTFTSPTPSGGTDMKDYYLASVFSHIHLQTQGDLALFGLHTTNTFYRDFLSKYGITVHTWKHGIYKNFANQFTHSRYNQAHADNVSNILRGIQQHILKGMYEARYEKLKDYEPSSFWRMVHHAGALPANMAQKIGFVDYLPPLNPLDDLISFNKDDKAEEKKRLESKWTSEDPESIPLTDLQQFPATKPISIMEYARKIKQKQQEKEEEWMIYDRLKSFPGGLQLMRGLFGVNASELDESKAKGRDEKIAVLKIGGPITDATARKLEAPLKQLKKQKDKIKAVVLRVDSPGGAVTACETISQQLQDLPQKVVVSFGNVSASGGYYISANSDRIFASPTSITGSIGVVMLRADLRGLAHQWGIHFDSIPSSDLSGTFDPFFPVNGRMKENFANYAERSYLHFKRLVSEGRGMDMNEVEKVAQGRVWTGKQAKEAGLVDELGGLDRAIAYCQRSFTESGNAQVVSWPPKKTLLQAWLDRKKKNGESDEDSFDNVEVPGAISFLIERYGSALGAERWFPKLLGMEDEKADGSQQSALSSVECAIREGRLPMAMSGMMLTLDENTAIRCLMEQNDV
eukprot:CAMPEP_0176020814 /NCGR_PEP_ID=MMETSP0120_2-20121206/10093_1 /TAXON_ID=160619 /ORGANISM="Kryptoperidinium foliaceum, Strain CCMP 1326" /LENGTH=756 /DNA_ID=CAMNT_0017353919 /DNA_START=61 /DNA_END=2328 /DNA_ORIENTATION=-